ncbi:MAG: DUF4982 domain-containing protein [Treponema sp.]|jgi:beta-galactosidase|nr:DUF4982 domain-containing protein [Treponema sp.]
MGKNSYATPFNSGWKFLLGDPKNAYREYYPDHTWKRIELPHDWVISQPYNRGAEGSWTSQNMQGFFAWKGIAWYRKKFALSDLTGKKVYVYFGGAYRNSKVYVNGNEVGGRACGYSSFELDISDFVKEGRNLIAVRLDNGCEAPDRWYSGSGLYRNVYLKTVPKAHIKTWGVHIKSTLAINKNQADIEIETKVVIHSAANVNIFIRMLKPDGSVAAEISTPFALAAKDDFSIDQRLRIKEPITWSADKPNLYRALVHLEVDGKMEQPLEIPFGIRDIEIACGTGMSVNGEKIKLKGVCLHHDCGITGSAYYDAVWRRRLLALKSAGCNAIRTSHNPPAEEFLDLCDELGFYVIDECFDKWKSGYYAEHFDKDAQRDLEDMILRDRNHPSVFMWSIGNEVENQGADSMLKIQKNLASIVRALDKRPITCGLSPHVNPRSLVGAPVSELVEITKKLSSDVDVLGLNYHEPLYRDYTAAINKPIVGTECYEYYSSSASNYEDVTTKNPWQFVLENDNVIGQFLWAGIDYLGESSWPAKGWTGAMFDICGFMKPNAFFRKSIWTDEPMIYLAFYDQSIKPDYARGRWSFPPLASHLNFDHFNRRTVTAMIFTNCDEAELLINGKKMGNRKPVDFENGIIEWSFEYASGGIEVRGYRNGAAVCSYKLKTAGEAKKILLKPDKKNLAPGCCDIAHVEINITDKDGILCPNEEALVEFALSGDGEIPGACSPDLNAALGFTLPKVITSGGKALVMIKAGHSSGSLELQAYSENLEPASLRFKVK